jgi:hypothetical protein
MTLTEAIALFEAKFSSVTTDDKAQYSKDHPVCWSGGIRSFSDSAWALYATRDAAILDWLDAALSMAESGTLRWLVRPELMEYIITISDQKGQHRVVNNRFAVKSQFVVQNG